METIGPAELLATLEHEVLHIILHHIPRYLRLRKLHGDNDNEKALFELCANTGMDLADNGLLRENHPNITAMALLQKQSSTPVKKSDPGKHLGYWVLPECFDPPVPAKLDYENYHRLLLRMFKERLKSDCSELYKLAKKALEQQSQALQNALNQAYPPPPSAPPPPGEGEAQGQAPAQAPGQGQPQPGDGQGQPQPGQGQGQPQPGDGQGQPQPGDGQGQGDGEQTLDQQLAGLDPVDQLAVQLLMKSLAQHMAWGAASDMNKAESPEGDAHKLEEHGRQLVRDSVRNAQKSRGTIPSNVAELIAKMLLPPTVPWTQFLHNIIQQTRQTKKIRGMSRPSKKLAAFKVYAHVSEHNDDN
jgi:hypothetical protein